jgi:hypothetical protein
MSKFQVKKTEPKPKDIEKFALAADSHTTELTSPTLNKRGRLTAEERLTINFTVRLSDADDQLLSEVFERSTEKSKQKLVRKILLTGLDAMRNDAS